MLDVTWPPGRPRRPRPRAARARPARHGRGRTRSASARRCAGRSSTSVSRSRSASSSAHRGLGLRRRVLRGYIVEKSLSVDNLFVFVLLMGAFAVPPEYQQRVLTSASSRARHARDVHRARRRAAVRVLVHVPDLRARARRDGDPALPPPRPGPVGRGQRDRRARQTLPAGDRGVRRGQARDPRRGPPRPDPALPGARGDREHGHRVRARLDPGRVRRDRGARTSSSRRTRSRCSACGRCTSSSPGC